MTYQAVQESRLLLALDATEETDNGDDAVERDGFEGLGLRRWEMVSDTSSFERFARRDT